MHDVILVGGGLANGLLAYRLRQLRPELDILVIEQGASFGGNHTWCFYHGDMTDAQRAWMMPLIAHRWDGYDVRFPQYARTLDTPYYCVTSERFHAVLQDTLGDRVLFDTNVTALTPDSVTFDGRTLHTKTVIDGRGQTPTAQMRYAYQKFVGLEIRLTRSHGRTRPVIMDATVPQNDGYRFVYTLPFDETHILIEDTYYSDHADMDIEAIKHGITAYAAQQGWDIAEILRQEVGVLPITLSGDIEQFWAEKAAPDVACVGLRAALFHPTTGYSLLHAVRLADALAALPVVNNATIDKTIRAMSLKEWRRHGFFRLINRMLFYAAQPDLRYKILQRFYRLSKDLIDRFYAGRITLYDRLRIVAGKPPVPIFAAIKAILNKGIPS